MGKFGKYALLPVPAILVALFLLSEERKPQAPVVEPSLSFFMVMVVMSLFYLFYYLRLYPKNRGLLFLSFALSLIPAGLYDTLPVNVAIKGTATALVFYFYVLPLSVLTFLLPLVAAEWKKNQTKKGKTKKTFYQRKYGKKK